MQVSLYLDKKILKTIDGVARRDRQSRSKVVQLLLERSLAKSESGGSLADLAGRWQDERSAEEIVAEVEASRARNRRAERRRPR